MGGGASNTSTTDLNVFQSAVTEVGQSIRAESENVSTQQVNKTQRIVLNNGSTAIKNPCSNRLPIIENCVAQNCSRLDDEPIYQCVIKRGNYTGITTQEGCDEAFGFTFNEANTDADGICNGLGPLADELTPDQRRTICENMSIRLTCEPNTPGSFVSYFSEVNSEGITVPMGCVSNGQCPVGGECDTSINQCGYRNFPGTIDPTCGGNCGNETKYIVEQINNLGVREFIYKDITEEIINQQNITQYCAFFTPTEIGDRCYTRLEMDDYFDCDKIPNSGGPYVGEDNEGFTDAFEQCSKTCSDIYSCSPEEIELFKPSTPTIIANGGICLNNTSNTSLVSSQIADTTVTAEMTTFLSNTFQNEVSKEIAQINSGLNFNQQNNSRERTTSTQKVKNILSQSISATAENINIQSTNTEQIIEVNNVGEIIASSGNQSCDILRDENGLPTAQCIATPTNPSQGFGPCGNAAFILNNDSTTQITSLQESKSTVDALLNSSVLNDISSKYSFKLTQANQGLDPLAWLSALLGMLLVPGVVVLLIVGMVVYFKFSTIKEIATNISKNPEKFALAIFCIIVLGYGCVSLYYYVGRGVPADKAFSFQWNTEEENQEGPPPPEDDPGEPKPGELECPITNLAGCSECSIFIRYEPDENGESTVPTGQDAVNTCFVAIDGLETDPNLTRSEQCQQITDRNLTIPNCEDPNCRLRNTTVGTIRLSCTDPVPTAAPTAAPTSAPSP